MQIHHFYPRTNNLGDHFVQIGIVSIVRAIDADASFHLFDVNKRGASSNEYGLTRSAIEKANREADLIIVGGSNLYEGAFAWPWGVHLDRNALKDLRVPLFLIGIGTGSAFASKTHKASSRAQDDIRLLNDVATLSWVRDIVTLEWLRDLGVHNAEMLGDPATFIFNSGLRERNHGEHILIVVPPARIWTSRRGFWKSRRFGRPIFKTLVNLVRHLLETDNEVIVACNDPRELDLAGRLFNSLLPKSVICPSDPQEYFRLLSGARAVVSGRLHTAAVALSMGIPFLLLDLDHRTRGFIETYQLRHAAIGWYDASHQLTSERVELLARNHVAEWLTSIRRRCELYDLAARRLRLAMESVAK